MREQPLLPCRKVVKYPIALVWLMRTSKGTVGCSTQYFSTKNQRTRPTAPRTRGATTCASDQAYCWPPQTTVEGTEVILGCLLEGRFGRTADNEETKER